MKQEPPNECQYKRGPKWVLSNNKVYNAAHMTSKRAARYDALSTALSEHYFDDCHISKEFQTHPTGSVIKVI